MYNGITKQLLLSSVNTCICSDHLTDLQAICDI